MALPALMPDVHHTRLLTHHLILSADDELLWAGKNLVDAFAYCRQHGMEEMRIISVIKSTIFLIRLLPDPPTNP